jgi:UPF0755 protein
MKKAFIIIFILIALIGGIAAWMVFGPATAFSDKKKFLYIYDNKDVKEQVEYQLDTGHMIHNKWLFNIMAQRLKVWDRLKPGRFEITKGESLIHLVRKLRNNQQSPIRLVINKLRTREDLAKVMGKFFSTDSLTAITFLSSNDSLQQLNVDTNTAMTLIIPDTYIIKWNTSVKKLLERFKNEEEKFWEKNDRLEKAKALGFTPEQIYTLASIVEEETNKNDEKGDIASVYINRYNKGMPLGADPTIKFALKDFGLKRILYGHLNINSPYNTYRNKGLPPGPICTPQKVTIDAVLDAPKTNYLFFVARSDFSGYHHFSDNYAEHQQYARLYQKALDEWMAAHSTK